MRRRLALPALALAGLAAFNLSLSVRDGTSVAFTGAAHAGPGHAGQDAAQQDNCLTCHFGIEDMHPWEPLSCTDCHGGDGEAETKEEAHVFPKRTPPGDERVLPLDYDPAYLRFKNPSNLRVVDQTCGQCHGAACQDLAKSLHGTTAGHLCDGMYEAGILEERGSRYGMFPVESDEWSTSEHSIERLDALPSYNPKERQDLFATHYRDLVPKNCVRCHLYAPGVAVRGRLGLDGDYRSEGCAACHVTYANDGLSKSGDPTIDRFEPGHGIRHEMTSAIPTDTCTHCHYGDASIGLNYRGLAQLFPGQPAGPEVPGTTDAQLNQAFYINDPRVTPADVHHTAGMHCIDCHTVRDVMGDGNVYGQMPLAVEIECVDCHGTIHETSRMVTSRGNPIDNLSKDGGRYYLTSKVTGKKHVVKQAAHVVSERHPDYNAAAAEAMTSEHDRMECYTCHGGWSPNFLGFHFDRNQQFTQLDMMTGERTPGRVTTQEKVFGTFRGFYMGWNTDGMIAPYMVGFSSMGTVHDEDGEVIIDQEMPVTANGLSGMALIHHQLHTTQRAARACADCHRNPTALGLGSPNSNFRLGRNFLFVGSARGLDVIGFDRKQLSASVPIANLPAFGVRGVAVKTEPLQGHVTHAYLAATGRGVMAVSLANPGFPEQESVVKTDSAHGVLVAADRLYIADGRGGVRIADISRPEQPKLIGQVDVGDARDLVMHWPFLYVADYDGGLAVVDVTVPQRAEVVATVDLNGDLDEANRATRIALFLMPSRPNQTDDGKRSVSRVLCAVACNENGLAVLDVTEPRQPQHFESAYQFLGGGGENGRGNLVTSVAAGMHVDLGSPDGAIPTAENDYLYVTAVTRNRAQSRLFVINVNDPRRPDPVGDARLGPAPSDIEIVNLYNPPFLQKYAVIAGGNVIEVIDVSKSGDPEGVAQFGGLLGAVSLAHEAMPLDRLVDESGSPWKDISHEDSRYFSRVEIDKILRADVPVPQVSGPVTPSGQPRQPPRRRGQ